MRSPNGPQKPSKPAPGYMAKWVPAPPTPEMALTTVPGVTAAVVGVKVMNPTFPVTKNLNFSGVPNFGPKNPVNWPTLVFTKVVPNQVLQIGWKIPSES